MENDDNVAIAMEPTQEVTMSEPEEVMIPTQSIVIGTSQEEIHTEQPPLSGGTAMEIDGSATGEGPAAAGGGVVHDGGVMEEARRGRGLGSRSGRSDRSSGGGGVFSASRSLGLLWSGRGVGIGARASRAEETCGQRGGVGFGGVSSSAAGAAACPTAAAVTPAGSPDGIVTATRAPAAPAKAPSAPAVDGVPVAAAAGGGNALGRGPSRPDGGDGPESLMMRLVDDFLFVTTSRAAAEAVVGRMHEGFPE